MGCLVCKSIGKFCSSCSEKTKQRRKDKASRGECASCPNKAVQGRKRCQACADKDKSVERKEKIKKARNEKKERGQCTKCTSFAVEGKTMCQGCLDDNKDRIAELKATNPDLVDAYNAKYRQGEAGKAAKERGNAASREKYNSDESFRLSMNIKGMASRLVSGATMTTSVVFFEKSAFDDKEHLFSHLMKFVDELGFKWFDYGVKWEIEHRIPVSEYNHCIPEDVMRCWSPANVRALPPKDNLDKSFKILISECHIVGKDWYPVSWAGKIPEGAV